MQYNISDDSVATFRIPISPLDYGERVDETYKRLRREVDVPGFRRGTVPMNLIKGKYGKSVLWEALVEMANTRMSEALGAQGRRIFGPSLVHQAAFNEIDVNIPLTYTLELMVAVLPVVELPQDVLGEVERYEVQVTNEDVELHVANLQNVFGIQEDVQEMDDSEGVFLYQVSLYPCDEELNEEKFYQVFEDEENPTPEEEQVEEELPTRLNGQIDGWRVPGFKKFFMGKKVGEKYLTNWAELSDCIEDIRNTVFRQLNDDVVNILTENPICVSLEKITKIHPHPRNHELYVKALEQNVSDDDELNWERMHDILVEAARAQRKHQTGEQIDKLIYEKIQIPTPVDHFVQIYLSEIGFKKTPDQFDQNDWQALSDLIGQFRRASMLECIQKTQAQLDLSNKAFYHFMTHRELPTESVETVASVDSEEDIKRLHPVDESVLMESMFEQMAERMEEDVEAGDDEDFTMDDSVGDAEETKMYDRIVQNWRKQQPQEFHQSYQAFLDANIRNYFSQNNILVKTKAVTFFE